MRINREYAEMFQDYTANKANQTAERRDAVQFVKQKLDSAQWFIDAIKQRNETLQRTMEAIIYLQRDFFLTGDEATLHPMILKDVAERAGYDISTISRVSNSKYVQTNFGIYPLKYFFSESMQTDTGEEISTREVKKIMKEHVDAEDKRKPLTDEELATILKEKRVCHRPAYGSEIQGATGDSGSSSEKRNIKAYETILEYNILRVPSVAYGDLWDRVGVDVYISRHLPVTCEAADCRRYLYFDSDSSRAFHLLIGEKWRGRRYRAFRPEGAGGSLSDFYHFHLGMYLFPV